MKTLFESNNIQLPLICSRIMNLFAKNIRFISLLLPIFSLPNPATENLNIPYEPNSIELTILVKDGSGKPLSNATINFANPKGEMQDFEVRPKKPGEYTVSLPTDLDLMLSVKHPIHRSSHRMIYPSYPGPENRFIALYLGKTGDIFYPESAFLWIGKGQQALTPETNLIFYESALLSNDSTLLTGFENTVAELNLKVVGEQNGLLLLRSLNDSISYYESRELRTLRELAYTGVCGMAFRKNSEPLSVVLPYLDIRATTSNLEEIRALFRGFKHIENIQLLNAQKQDFRIQFDTGIGYGIFEIMGEIDKLKGIKRVKPVLYESVAIDNNPQTDD